jgi:phosphoribosylanthranilate isomerase
VRALVKICGITSVEDGLMAAEAGVQAVGLVFWEGSPRRVDKKKAREIAGALPPGVWRVGVFVDATRAELAACCEAVPLDVVQLHGDESPKEAAGLGRKVWKAVRVGRGFAPGEALRFGDEVSGIVLDTKAGVPGGSGKAFDWELAREVRRAVPFLVLAGGLDPQNVAAAIRAVHPDVVDVSTGVESRPGRKDPAKVKAFLEAVRRQG